MTGSGVTRLVAERGYAALIGPTGSKLKRTGKLVTTDFAIILTVCNGEIVRFQMLEDSFAVS